MQESDLRYLLTHQQQENLSDGAVAWLRHYDSDPILLDESGDLQASSQPLYKDCQNPESQRTCLLRRLKSGSETIGADFMRYIICTTVHSKLSRDSVLQLGSRNIMFTLPSFTPYQVSRLAS